MGRSLYHWDTKSNLHHLPLPRGEVEANEVIKIPICAVTAKNKHRVVMMKHWGVADTAHRLERTGAQASKALTKNSSLTQENKGFKSMWTPRNTGLLGWIDIWMTLQRTGFGAFDIFFLLQKKTFLEFDKYSFYGKLLWGKNDKDLETLKSVWHGLLCELCPK